MITISSCTITRSHFFLAADGTDVGRAQPHNEILLVKLQAADSPIRPASITSSRLAFISILASALLVCIHG